MGRKLHHGKVRGNLHINSTKANNIQKWQRVMRMKK